MRPKVGGEPLAKGRANVRVSDRNSRVDRRHRGGLRKSGPTRLRGKARAGDHDRARRRRRDRLPDGPYSPQGPGQPRFSPRWPDDRAAGQCGRCPQGRPGRRPARPPDSGQCAALGRGQPRVDAGGADPGAPHLRAAAATLEGRLDHTRQFRRGPAEAPERRGPGRLRSGSGADRARAAELHGVVSRLPGRCHRDRRRVRAKWSTPGR